MAGLGKSEDVGKDVSNSGNGGSSSVPLTLYKPPPVLTNACT